MDKICKISWKEFSITQKDLDFYKQIWVPEPTLSPEERQRRRMVWRNDRIFYKRSCDFSGKKIISMYDEDTPFPVYNQDEWWSDKWNSLDYGREFDFSRSFFEQFSDLINLVPRISLINKNHDNAEYCNFALGNKNSYLLFTSWGNDSSAYLNRSWSSNDTLDGINIKDCSLCYDITDSSNCHKSIHVINCSSCSHCMFSENLTNCNNCFWCSNLINKEYYIGNTSIWKEKYQSTVDDLLSNPEKLTAFLAKQHTSKFYKNLQGTGNSNCTGNFISYSKDSHNCFDGSHLEDCAYSSNITESKNVYDTDNDDHSEIVYETIWSEKNYFCLFNDICWFNSHLMYSSLCFDSKNSFGCVWLRNNEYCILNKQYTKEQYESLLPKIIAHMKASWEWGEFFPISLSPFSYNESIAQDYFPLDQSAVEGLWWKWKTEKQSARYEWAIKEVPENIDEVSDDILTQILECTSCSKNYRIVWIELELYRKLGISVPRNCFNCRHTKRLENRRNRNLSTRECNACHREITTIHSQEDKIVCCEVCYEKNVN